MIDLHIQVNKGARYKSVKDGTVVMVALVLSTEVLIQPIILPIADKGAIIGEVRWIRKHDLMKNYQLVDK